MERITATYLVETPYSLAHAAQVLAGVIGKLATLGLATAVISPWMNISYLVLCWRIIGRRKNSLPSIPGKPFLHYQTSHFVLR